MKSLTRRLTLPFVAFVVAGSLALVLWIGVEERRQSRGQFVAMARTNAAFIRAQNLPISERTAQALGEVLGVGVHFVDALNTWLPIGPGWTKSSAMEYQALPAEGGVFMAEVSTEAAVARIAQGRSLLLLRTAEPLSEFLFRPRTLGVLGAFWAFSLALAWVLARGIVRPLRRFAARLPHIAEENAEPLPEASRTDEIGQLARAYDATRAQLADERHAREQAERLATLGKMTTGLAHEINNPVAAIKLHTQLLEAEVAGAHGERLAIILSETAKIESLVSQWMFLARPQPPQLAPCDLADLISASVKTLTPAAAHAKVKITNQLVAGLVVNGDRRRLAQAFDNIIINAIHAMSARGGELNIECRMENISGRKFIVTFTDTGSGFSTAAIAHGTELFFSEKEGGMGIGLSVTSEILRAHNGELRLANSAIGGAEVCLHLPSASVDQTHRADRPSQSSTD